MVGDVYFLSQRDRPPILTPRKVESLELYAEHHGGPLYLVLLCCRHLLFTFLTLVHVLSLPKALPLKVSTQSCVYIVCRKNENVIQENLSVKIRQTCLPDIQKKIHEVLEGSGDIFTSHAHNILKMSSVRDCLESPPSFPFFKDAFM